MHPTNSTFLQFTNNSGAPLWIKRDDIAMILSTGSGCVITLNVAGVQPVHVTQDAQTVGKLIEESYERSLQRAA